MAASSKNKVNLRELMKKQRSGPKTTKKIDSPLAKYNNIGQLICVVCSTQIKSELLWPAHIQGKKHKDNIAALKTKTQPVRTDTFVKPTTPALSNASTSVKRKSDVPDISSTSEKKLKVPESTTNTTGKSSRLPIDFYDSDSESSEEETETSNNNQGAASSTSSSQLPPDFFDSSVTSKSTVEDTESTSTSKSNTAEALPEGFFDDPVMDAKVRKVEVKDPMTEEWEKFQKSIAEETNVSEAIEAEEDEERQRERQIDEIDEQIHCLQKVEKLRDKREEISTMSGDKTGQEGNEEQTSETEEAEFEEFLDWRSKGAWR